MIFKTWSLSLNIIIGFMVIPYNLVGSDFDVTIEFYLKLIFQNEAIIYFI